MFSQQNQVGLISACSFRHLTISYRAAAVQVAVIDFYRYNKNLMSAARFAISIITTNFI